MNTVFGSGFVGMMVPGGKEHTKRVRFETRGSWRLAYPQGICLTGDQLQSHSSWTSLEGL